MDIRGRITRKPELYLLRGQTDRFKYHNGALWSRSVLEVSTGNRFFAQWNRSPATQDCLERREPFLKPYSHGWLLITILLNLF